MRNGFILTGFISLYLTGFEDCWWFFLTFRILSMVFVEDSRGSDDYSRGSSYLEDYSYFSRFEDPMYWWFSQFRGRNAKKIGNRDLHQFQHLGGDCWVFEILKLIWHIWLFREAFLGLIILWFPTVPLQ